MTLVQMAQGMGDDAPAHEETKMRTHLDGARRKQKFPDASRFPISSITMSSSSDPTRFHVNTPRTTFSMVTIPVRTERAEDLDGKYIKSHSNPPARAETKNKRTSSKTCLHKSKISHYVRLRRPPCSLLLPPVGSELHWPPTLRRTSAPITPYLI